MWPNLQARDLKFFQSMLLAYFFECLCEAPYLSDEPILPLPAWTRPYYTPLIGGTPLYRRELPLSCNGEHSERNARIWLFGHKSDRQKVGAHLETCVSCLGLFASTRII